MFPHHAADHVTFQDAIIHPRALRLGSIACIRNENENENATQIAWIHVRGAY